MISCYCWPEADASQREAEQGAMVTRDGCPQCGSQQYKKNSHIHNGKQNHQCKVCERQFVGRADQHRISDEQRALVERLLLERISLRGICRAVGVGLKWLLGFLAECYAQAPQDLNVHLPTQPAASCFIASKWRRTRPGASLARKRTANGSGLPWMRTLAK